MGCGCGGSTGGSGGCGGGARPEIEVPVDAPLFEELPHEEDSEPAAEQASGEPLLIASSEQEWPRVRVNGVAIASQAIAQELQYHPAESREEAVYLATQALVLRELLQQAVECRIGIPHRLVMHGCIECRQALQRLWFQPVRHRRAALRQVRQRGFERRRRCDERLCRGRERGEAEPDGKTKCTFFEQFIAPGHSRDC